jgi:hypothetical protein
MKLTGKRRLLCNRFGNINAYVSGRRVWEFGTDSQSANEWLEFGCWYTGGMRPRWVQLADDGSRYPVTVDADQPAGAGDEKLRAIWARQVPAK